MRPNDMDWEELCGFMRNELKHMTVKEFIAKYSVPDTGDLADRPLNAQWPAPPFVSACHDGPEKPGGS